MVQYARIESRNAYMSSDFGRDYAVRLFGQEAVDNLPKISRGKRKGMTKGMLLWEKCTTGGWRNDPGTGLGGVVYPGFVRAWIEVDGKKVLDTIYPTHAHKLEHDAAEAAQRELHRRQWELDKAQIMQEIEAREST